MKNRGNKIIWVALIVFLLSVLQIFFSLKRAYNEHPPVDLRVYQQAISDFQFAKNPYQVEQGRVPFNYPPSTLALLYPAVFLPHAILPWLAVIINICLLTASIFIVTKILKSQISLAENLILSALFLQTFAVKFTLVLGQLNIVVLFLVLVTIYYSEKSEIASAFALALACGLKTLPLALVPVFVLRKKWVLVALVVLLQFLFTILPGSALARQYYTQIAPALASNIGYSNFYDQSFVIFLMRLTHNPVISRWLGLTVLGCLYVLSLMISRDNFKLGAFMILALVSIGNTFSWQHHLVLTLPLILWIYTDIRSKNSLYSRLFICSAWIMLVVHFPDERSIWLKNPFIISYQTILVLFLLTGSLFVHYRSQVSRQSKQII